MKKKKKKRPVENKREARIPAEPIDAFKRILDSLARQGLANKLSEFQYNLPRIEEGQSVGYSRIYLAEDEIRAAFVDIRGYVISKASVPYMAIRDIALKGQGKDPYARLTCSTPFQQAILLAAFPAIECGGARWGGALNIYTDASQDPDTGVGAWSYVVSDGASERENGSGTLFGTSSTRAECMAILAALSASVKYSPEEVRIYSDCKSVVDALNNMNGWSDDKDIRDKILSVEKMLGCNVRLFWIKGHSDSSENRRCDRLCRELMQKHRNLIPFCEYSFS